MLATLTRWVSGEPGETENMDSDDDCVDLCSEDTPSLADRLKLRKASNNRTVDVLSATSNNRDLPTNVRVATAKNAERIFNRMDTNGDGEVGEF